MDENNNEKRYQGNDGIFHSYLAGVPKGPQARGLRLRDVHTETGLPSEDGGIAGGGGERQDSQGEALGPGAATDLETRQLGEREWG